MSHEDTTILLSIPEPVLYRAVCRLLQHERVRKVANSMMTLPRGELQHAGYHRTRDCVALLRQWINLYIQERGEDIFAKSPPTANDAREVLAWIRFQLKRCDMRDGEGSG